VFLYADRRASRKTAQLLHAAELDRIRRSKLAFESRLQAMQARVEPQFLFNTLAQVERLYELDPALGSLMLDDLIAYSARGDAEDARYVVDGRAGNRTGARLSRHSSDPSSAIVLTCRSTFQPNMPTPGCRDDACAAGRPCGVHGVAGLERPRAPRSGITNAGKRRAACGPWIIVR
jgi:hypothetical protein